MEIQEAGVRITGEVAVGRVIRKSVSAEGPFQQRGEDASHGKKARGKESGVEQE